MVGRNRMMSKRWTEAKTKHGQMDRHLMDKGWDDGRKVWESH